ncbi:MAG TPA: hypothetical protein VMV94_21440 [Phycisphaerae bacterium]|nr:hypothetical protein [Phycisphaerae bacterium]
MPPTRPPKPSKWNQPKHWRLRATAADGLTITLGRYETAEQAHADRETFAGQGGYRNLSVERIEPKPEPPPSADGTPPPRRRYSHGH